MKRRNMLFISTSAVGFVGAGLAVWPLFAQLKPDASIEKPLVIDLSDLAEDEVRTFRWNGKPVFAHRRNADALAHAQKFDLRLLKDQNARNRNSSQTISATDQNRAIPSAPSILIFEALCTHEPCVVLSARLTYLRTEYDNGAVQWMCPCCATKFDSSARAFQGPASQNLTIPLYVDLGNARIQVGPNQLDVPPLS